MLDVIADEQLHETRGHFEQMVVGRATRRIDAVATGRVGTEVLVVADTIAVTVSPENIVSRRITIRVHQRTLGIIRNAIKLVGEHDHPAPIVGIVGVAAGRRRLPVEEEVARVNQPPKTGASDAQNLLGRVRDELIIRVDRIGNERIASDEPLLSLAQSVHFLQSDLLPGQIVRIAVLDPGDEQIPGIRVRCGRCRLTAGSRSG